MWKVRLTKVRATWNWFTTNPLGGGFGSNQVSTKASVLARAIQNIPPGAEYQLEVNGKVTTHTKGV